MTKNTSKALSYLALGDSYTVGEGLPMKHCFPALLAKSLQKLDLNVKVKVIAETGWTTDELLTALKSESLVRKYDLVSLLIGVNNQYRGYPDHIFKAEFKKLLKKAIGYAKSPDRVIVISIPDYGVTPFGLEKDKEAKVSRHIDRLNAFSRSHCAKKSIAYCDITTCSRELSSQGLLVKDDLHYSARMYRRWVKLLRPIVVGLLRSAPN